MIKGVLQVYADIRNLLSKLAPWKRGRYEDKVDRVVMSRNERAASKLMQDVEAKRNKRRKKS